MHVEIFKVLFNHEIRQHIITETIRYTTAQQNDNLFEIPERDLKCYVGTLFLLDRSLQQFGFWHLDYSIVEQMIPYFGMHSAKQTVWNKSVRFGYKNFVLASSDGYPYILIPYAGAKGIGGTPGKDLTIRVVTELVLKSSKGTGNLTFGNWYTSAKLISLLTALHILSIGTVRADRVGNAPVLSTKGLEKQEHGFYSYAFDDSMSLHCVKWLDNSVVTLLSNCIRPFPLDSVERFFKVKKKKISVLSTPSDKTVLQCYGQSRSNWCCSSYIQNKIQG